LINSAIAHDPAIEAVAAFREVQRRFEKWLGQDHACFLDQVEVDRQEAEWQADHETKLDAAAKAIPTSRRGVQALSDVFAHQERMGAPRGILETASRSIQWGLSRLPASERMTS
jgi:hypothetical protein